LALVVEEASPRGMRGAMDEEEGVREEVFIG
jgi:hypothetical protein